MNLYALLRPQTVRRCNDIEIRFGAELLKLAGLSAASDAGRLASVMPRPTLSQADLFGDDDEDHGPSLPPDWSGAMPASTTVAFS